MSSSIPTYPGSPTDRASAQWHTSPDLPTAASPSVTLSLLSFSFYSFVSQSAAIFGCPSSSVSSRVRQPPSSPSAPFHGRSSCPSQQPCMAASLVPISAHSWPLFMSPSVAVYGCLLVPVSASSWPPLCVSVAAIYGRLLSHFAFSSSTVHIRCRILNGFLVECTCPAKPVINRWLLSAERICRCVLRSTYPCPAS